MFDLRIESGSLSFVRYSLFPNRLGILDSTGHWYRSNENVYLDIDLGTTGASSVSRRGFKPTRHTKPRIMGESDTTHLNLKGSLTLGKAGDYHNEVFADAVFRYHPYNLELRPGLVTSGVLIKPGETIRWRVPNYYSGYNFQISCEEIDVPMPQQRGFILRYHINNGWTKECFVGILLDLHTNCFWKSNVWQVQMLDGDTSVARTYESRIRQQLRTAIAATPWNTDVHLATDDLHSLSDDVINERLGRITKTEFESRLRDSIFVDPDVRRRAIGNLAQSACDGFKPVQANALSTFIEIAHLKGEVTDWIDGLQEVAKNVRHPAKLIQAIGNLRLSTKWGIPLTVKDARQIADCFTNDLVYGRRQDRWQSQRRSDGTVPAFGRGLLRGVQIEHVIGLKAIVSKYDNRTRKALSYAFDYGFLSYSNVWDMIPYSFVVDWFTNVSERVELIDSTFYKDTFLDVGGSVVTEKFSFPLSAATLEKLLGIPVKESTLECTLFTREVSKDLPWPTLQDKELSLNLGFVQYLDGATLIFQRVNLG